jgi:RsiW-degrading membrane proteinase PrsW (M82 family)
LSGLAPQVPPQLLRRRRSPLGWVSMIVLGLGALAVAVVVFLIGGPVGSVVTTMLAAVSFPLLILVFFWLDRYEPEPGRYRLAALAWGGVVAVVLSFVGEQLFFAIPGANDFLDTAVIAPVIEEFSKGLFLVAIVVLRRSQVHGLLDGIVYAGLVAIGFAFVEDIVYYLGSLTSGGPEDLTVTFILRGVMSPFAHPLFTSATGVGIGVAVNTRRPAVRVFAPILGYLLAVMLHGLWNGSTFYGSRGYFTTYAGIMLPLLVVVLAVAIWARYREGKMLRAALEEVVAMGWIRPDEVRWVARLSDRMSSRGYAKIHGGKPAQRVLRAYQQTLTEIAFLHARAVAGTAPRDLNLRMDVLLRQAAELRPYVILPPPVLTGPRPR